MTLHPLLQRKREVFGVDEFPPALFYQFDVALRFELGGERGRRLQQFWRALNRARDVAQALFSQSKEVQVLFGAYERTPEPWVHLARFVDRGEFDADRFEVLAVTQDHTADELDGPCYKHWNALKIRNEEEYLDFLWFALSGELGIKPSAPMKIYLVDFDKRAALHPYDDRGMDVIAMNKDAIRPLFDRFKDWLLDCDMPRMNATFGAD